MLQEAFLWLTTPCSAGARRMGYLSAAIGLVSRYRRCQAAWAPHLQRTRECLEHSALSAPGDGVALVLGSGLLLDVPIESLSRHFREVVLVDVVHLNAVRRRARRLGNVRLLEMDVTGCMDALLDLPAQQGELPTPSDAGLRLPDLRWVASVNMLSQLYLLPEQWVLARWPELPAQQLDAWARGLLKAHLAFLTGIGVPYCVVSDIEQFTLGPDERALEHTDFFALLKPLGPAQAEWRWQLAPKGELSDGMSSCHRVGAWWR